MTGRGRYVDDVAVPGTLHVAFVRSPHAHAELRSVDVGPALAAGARAALTGADVAARIGPLLAKGAAPTLQATPHYALALDRVRFMGEAVAAVAAESRYQAEDLAELIAVQYDPLPAVADMEAALGPDAPVLHPAIGDNRLFHASFGKGDLEGACAAADVVIRRRLYSHRYAPVPMETRGCLAQHDPAAGTLTVWLSSQIPHVARTLLSEVFGIPEHKVRVISPDVGGGFGLKGRLFPEDLVVCLLAMQLGRPVKWIEDRAEHLAASHQSREEVHYAELAARRDGTILAFRDRFVDDCGAYAAYPWGGHFQGALTARSLPGPYRLENFSYEYEVALTNKCPIGAYRGIWGPTYAFVQEVMIDLLARALDLDPADVRRRNLIRPEELPYVSATGVQYDSGDYPAALDQALAAVEYADLRARQAALRQEGRLLGIGICNFVEPYASGSPKDPNAWLGRFESARVRVHPSGTVTVATGLHSHGQGHETTLAQIVAAELGIGPEEVAVEYGDTDSSPYGIGTHGSRAIIVGGGAAILAARVIRDKALRIAAHLLEVDVDDLELRDGAARVKGSPERSMPWTEIAKIALVLPYRLPPDEEAGLEATRYYEPPPVTTSNGVHVALVEVDRETGAVEILKYVVVEDCGRAVNPLLVEGQLQGGVVQGLGGVLLEHSAYDSQGQYLASTFMDYLLPTSADVPPIDVHLMETPSFNTLGGFKGIGESGAIGPPGAIVNAVADALTPLGVEVTEQPVTPERVRRLIADASGRQPSAQEGKLGGKTSSVGRPA